MNVVPVLTLSVGEQAVHDIRSDVRIAPTLHVEPAAGQPSALGADAVVGPFVAGGRWAAEGLMASVHASVG
ncbi:hypothetical protein [Streptomyces sp. HUAS TT7]|uniref:hypothetical protein n=1 Tax=Streptomyces sp. HUAS TT7 TaxID=3447507 RepID=UPI003F65D3C0